MIFYDFMKPELKETVIKSLENADERLLKMIKALVESYNEEEAYPSTLNEEYYRIINRRRMEYLEDPEDIYTWEEVKENIRNASKK